MPAVDLSGFSPGQFPPSIVVAPFTPTRKSGPSRAALRAQRIGASAPVVAPCMARGGLTKGHVRQHAEIAKYAPDAPCVRRGAVWHLHSSRTGTKVTGVITHLR